MTELHRQLVTDKIVKNCHALGDTVIVRTAEYMVKGGYPQLYIRRLNRVTDEWMGEFWVRIADLDTDFNELELWQCRDIDSQLKLRGERTITAKTVSEVMCQVCDILRYDIPDLEDLYGL